MDNEENALMNSQVTESIGFWPLKSLGPFEKIPSTII